MKKFIFLPAFFFVAITVFTGCNDDPTIYCPTGCVDIYGNCATCDVVPPVVEEPVIEWEQIPGHGVFPLHGGGTIKVGINTMTDEYGARVYVKISADVYGPANILATNEIQMYGLYWARPLLITYTVMPEPIMVPGYGPIYRFANAIEICTMCGW